MAQTIRVLNAVRHYEIGIPLTLTQYDDCLRLSVFSFGASRYRRLKPQALVDRLLNRHHHLLAMRIAAYRKDKVRRF